MTNMLDVWKAGLGNFPLKGGLALFWGFEARASMHFNTLSLVGVAQMFQEVEESGMLQSNCFPLNLCCLKTN